MIFCRVLNFFKINFFKKFFQEYNHSVKQFGSSSGLEVIKLFSCSTQLGLKFIILINVKIVGILTFISMIIQHLRVLKQEVSLFFGILVFVSTQLS